MVIVNLNDSNFPYGVEFYLKNSLYPRMKVYCEEFDIDLIVCPHYGEAVSFENFVNNYDYCFYKAPGEENNPDYFGVSFTQP